MKKCSFMTLVLINGEVCAKEVFGYTDGDFYYYDSRNSCNAATFNGRGKRGWFAVVPNYGRSLGLPHKTRKEAISEAHNPDVMKKLAAKIEKCGEKYRELYTQKVEQASKNMELNTSMY